MVTVSGGVVYVILLIVSTLVNVILSVELCHSDPVLVNPVTGNNDNTVLPLKQITDGVATIVTIEGKTV